ncbi:MAG TPA: D-alanyl-D-alanine carboxypeptidase family protein [Rhizomicrobium sp.]|nr:D-alanyl-D-alanine carboxypeptidase family protein [Rhizomicrobium sp.]
MRSSRLWFAFLLSILATSVVPASAGVLETSAEHALLMDAASGQVLWAKDAYAPMPPASMSKLMTLELLFQRLKDHRLKLSDTFTVSERAWSTQGSKMFVKLGDKIPVEDLIRGIIIDSGNDACIVVAEGIGGTVENFVSMMNARAKQLGLAQSHFVNPDGLPDPPGQLMSALDLAKLARHLIVDYPQYYPYFGEHTFSWSNITQNNRDTVLSKLPGADGLKTGHTDAAGYGITVSAKQNGRRLILVLNGLRYPDLDKSSPARQDWVAGQRRGDEAARILSIAFREFRQYKLFDAGEKIGDADVWQGDRDTVPLTIQNPLSVTLTPEARASMKVAFTYDGPVKAPIARGQKIGMLDVTAPGYPDLKVPLVAAESAGSAGWFGRIFLGVRAIFSRHSGG